MTPCKRRKALPLVVPRGRPSRDGASIWGRVMSGRHSRGRRLKVATSKANSIAFNASSRPSVIHSKAVIPRSFQKKGSMLAPSQFSQRAPVVRCGPHNRKMA